MNAGKMSQTGMGGDLGRTGVTVSPKIKNARASVPKISGVK